MVEARFLGHATVQLTNGQTTLILDPLLDGNPLCPVGAADIEADLVVLSKRGGLLGSNPEVTRYSEAQGSVGSASY
jgi:hypothetical protein